MTPFAGGIPMRPHIMTCHVAKTSQSQSKWITSAICFAPTELLGGGGEEINRK